MPGAEAGISTPVCRLSGLLCGAARFQPDERLGPIILLSACSQKYMSHRKVYRVVSQGCGVPERPICIHSWMTVCRTDDVGRLGEQTRQIPDVEAPNAHHTFARLCCSSRGQRSLDGHVEFNVQAVKQQLVLKKSKMRSAVQRRLRTTLNVRASHTSSSALTAAALEIQERVRPPSPAPTYHTVDHRLRNRPPSPAPTYRTVDNQLRVGLESDSTVNALIEAAKSADERVLIKLLEEGGHANARDCNGSTALHRAVREHRDKQMAELLLKYGADVDAEDSSQATALFWAVDNKDQGIVILLLEKGADIHFGRTGRSPLYQAVDSQDKDMVALLLEKWTGDNSEDQRGWEALHLATFASRDKEMVTLMAEKGFKIDVPDAAGESAFTRAAAIGDWEMAVLLLRRGADINGEDTGGRTAMWWTIRHGHPKMVRLLIEKGASINGRDSGGATALHWVVREASPGLNQNKILKILLENGADIDAKDSVGYTALDWAVCFDRRKLITLLLMKGATSWNVSRWLATPYNAEELP